MGDVIKLNEIHLQPTVNFFLELFDSLNFEQRFPNCYADNFQNEYLINRFISEWKSSRSYSKTGRTLSKDINRENGVHSQVSSLKAISQSSLSPSNSNYSGTSEEGSGSLGYSEEEKLEYEKESSEFHNEIELDIKDIRKPEDTEDYNSYSVSNMISNDDFNYVNHTNFSADSNDTINNMKQGKYNNQTKNIQILSFTNNQIDTSMEAEGTHSKENPNKKEKLNYDYNGFNLIETAHTLHSQYLNKIHNNTINSNDNISSISTEEKNRA